MLNSSFMLKYVWWSIQISNHKRKTNNNSKLLAFSITFPHEHMPTYNNLKCTHIICNIKINKK